MDNSVCYDAAAAFACYPDSDQINAWSETLYARAKDETIHGEFMNLSPVTPWFGNNPNTQENRFVRFRAQDHSFYGYWQPALKTPAPLLINLPGYGAYVSNHPQLNDDGFHVLHISPMGYTTPSGIDVTQQMEDKNWPVLDLTARGEPGGYADWLLDVLLAIRWARERPEVIADRVSLFGTSQGGGASLLVASIMQEEIRCVCADLPFLTAFPLSELQGEAYGILRKSYREMPHAQFWFNLGLVDTLSHAHRLHIPVMLSAGGQDHVCPREGIEELFRRLNTTKQYSFLTDVAHTHSRESMYLFRSWFALFA